MADALPDHYEVRYGLAPDQPDSDADGITDGYELMRLGADVLATETPKSGDPPEHHH
jgi:hypothetical protein